MLRVSATVALGFGSIRLPYLYSEDFEAACRAIRGHGYDAVELLVADPGAISHSELETVLDRHDLRLSALGTGGGWISRRLHLCSADETVRSEAEDYIRRIVDLAGPFQAGVILGLMTGVLEEGVNRERAFGWLVPALRRLRDYAAACGARLLLEPLNRDETNFVNTLADGAELIDQAGGGIALLADLYHMNIEEASIAGALREYGRHVGHVHFVDSNRLAPGMGDMDYAPIAAALAEIGYDGYLAVEAFPEPDPDTAARAAIEAFRRWFPVP